MIADLEINSFCQEYQEYFKDTSVKSIERLDTILNKIESRLKFLLKQNKHDMDVHVGLALAELMTPFNDYETSISVCEDIFQSNPSEDRAKILLAHNYDYHTGVIDQTTIDRLNTIGSRDVKILSAKELLLGKACRDKDSGKFVAHLERSLELYPQNLSSAIELYFFDPLKMAYQTSLERGIEFSKQHMVNLKYRRPIELLDFGRILHDDIFGLSRMDYDFQFQKQ